MRRKQVVIESQQQRGKANRPIFLRGSAFLYGSFAGIALPATILDSRRTNAHIRGAMVRIRETTIEAHGEVPPARMADDERKKRGESGAPGTAVITKTKPQTKRPNLYRVLLLNDDYTPMEFVVLVLERFFNKDRDAATRIMLHVHNHGIGECGVYTYEVAETKVTQVMDFARKHQHPLQCVMEKK